MAIMRKSLRFLLLQLTVLFTLGISIVHGAAQPPTAEQQRLADLAARIDHIQVRKLDLGGDIIPVAGTIQRMEIVAYGKDGKIIPLSAADAQALFTWKVKNTVNLDVAHLTGASENTILSDKGRNFVEVMAGQDQGAAQLLVTLSEKFGRSVTSYPGLLASAGGKLPAPVPAGNQIPVSPKPTVAPQPGRLQPPNPPGGGGIPNSVALHGNSWDGGPGSTLGDKIINNPVPSQVPNAGQGAPVQSTPQARQFVQGQSQSIQPQNVQGNAASTAEGQTSPDATSADQGAQTDGTQTDGTQAQPPDQAQQLAQQFAADSSQRGVWRSQYPTDYQPAPAPNIEQPQPLIDGSGGQPLGGVGATQGAPDTPPPPNPGSVLAAANVVHDIPVVKPPPPAPGINPVLVGVGVAGAVGGAVLIGVALSSAAKAATAAEYHCASGSSWCYNTSTCCPSYWISAGGVGVWAPI